MDGFRFRFPSLTSVLANSRTHFTIIKLIVIKVLNAATSNYCVNGPCLGAFYVASVIIGGME